MDEELEITITGDGKVLIPWAVKNFDELVDRLKKELGESGGRIKVIYGKVRCG